MKNTLDKNKEICSEHGTIIRTGIICKKLPCYMRDSASLSGAWIRVPKKFEFMLNNFEYPRMKNCRILSF